MSFASSFTTFFEATVRGLTSWYSTKLRGKSSFFSDFVGGFGGGGGGGGGISSAGLGGILSNRGTLAPSVSQSLLGEKAFSSGDGSERHLALADSSPAPNGLGAGVGGMPFGAASSDHGRRSKLLVSSSIFFSSQAGSKPDSKSKSGSASLEDNERYDLEEWYDLEEFPLRLPFDVKGVPGLLLAFPCMSFFT